MVTAGPLILTCPACGHTGPCDLDWIVRRDGGYQLGAYCPKCAQWLKWMAQTAGNVRQAPPKPPRMAQFR